MRVKSPGDSASFNDYAAALCISLSLLISSSTWVILSLIVFWFVRTFVMVPVFVATYFVSFSNFSLNDFFILASRSLEFEWQESSTFSNLSVNIFLILSIYVFSSSRTASEIPDLLVIPPSGSVGSIVFCFWRACSYLSSSLISYLRISIRSWGMGSSLHFSSSCLILALISFVAAAC